MFISPHILNIPNITQYPPTSPISPYSKYPPSIHNIPIPNILIFYSRRFVAVAVASKNGIHLFRP